jgi:hypothetical protein
MKLSKYQQQVLDKLRRGAKIRWEITGYYGSNGKRINRATVEALLRTGFAVKKRITGKHMTTDYIVGDTHG